MARVGDIRVNCTDYDSGIVIEEFRYGNYSTPHWGVPAWDERGLGDLAGPFATAEAAQVALDAALAS